MNHLFFGDSGKPSLTAYRRVILKVSGKPAAGTAGVTEDSSKPITKLTGPTSKGTKWRFYRGVNLNGPAIEIDGNKWGGDRAANFTCKDKAINSPQVSLRPPTDAARARMIHSFRWDRTVSISMTALPGGKYAVYAYVWEDNNSETFTISLSGREVARDYNSGQRGRWRRLGPWLTTVSKGKIDIITRGGAANFSGLEVWKADSPDP